MYSKLSNTYSNLDDWKCGDKWIPPTSKWDKPCGNDPQHKISAKKR